MENKNIKFRIWDKANNSFINKGEPCDLANISYLYQSNIINVLDDNLILLSFTGIKDINDREIYEGDLVNFLEPGFAHAKYPENWETQEVWYDSDSAGFIFGKFYYDGWHGYHPYEIKNIEIVGNIFENPPKK